MPRIVGNDGASKAVYRVGGERDYAAVTQHRCHALHGSRVRIRGVDANELIVGNGREGRKGAASDRDEDARATRKVLTDLDRRPAFLRAHDIGRLIEMTLVQLTAEHAPRAKRRRSEVHQTPEDVETVGAAVERELGLVVLDLGGDLVLKNIRGNIGGIAHQNGERAHERGIHPRGEIALHNVHGIGEAERIAVSRGEVDCLGREVGRDHACAFALVGDRKRDAAGAAADLKDTRGHAARSGSRGVNALERRIHKHLSLGTRDEHALLATKDDVTKSGLARNVLKRLAGGTSHNGGAHAGALVGGERTVEIDVELHAREPHDVAKEPFGREPRVLVAMTLEVPAGPIYDLLDIPGGFRVRHSPLSSLCVTAS